MSDTDDTDVLLVIPPDFFTVSTSDTDESFDGSCLRDRSSGVESIHVKDLLHQVHNLENRISLIENKDNFSSDYFDHLTNHILPDSSSYPPLTYQGDCNPNYLQVSDTLHPSVRLGSVSNDSSPVKRIQITSLASHLIRSRGKDSESSSYDSGAVLTDPVSLSTESSMEIHSVRNMPSSNSVDGTVISNSSTDAKQTSQSYHKTDLIKEIDDFLENVKRNPQSLNHHKLITERYKKEKAYRCGDNVGSIPDLNFGLRDLSKMPVREPPAVSKYFAPLGPKPPSSTANRLSLPEVNKLLDEMEATQMQMEQKLRMREAQFGKGNSKSADSLVSFPRRPSLCGDSVGSVPDLGFGIREVMASQASDGSRTPVQEPKVTKRSISLCGVNPTPQTSSSSKVGSDAQGPGNVVDTNVPKVSVPKRLQLGEDPDTIPDLGFGLKNWYKSTESSTSDAQTKNVQTAAKENPTHPSSKYIQGGLPSSIPDLGFGIRDLWTGDVTSKTDVGRNPNASLKQTETNAQKPATTEAPYAQKVGYSTQSGVRDTVVLDQEYGAGKPHANPSQLPSLTGLWKEQGGTSSVVSESDINILQHKLEEERYRRQHCEQMIQHLQMKLLEEQQKLAVAVQVDTGKDQAILHFQNAWSQLVGHWQELEEQRNNLALQVQGEKEQYQQYMRQSLQKMKNCEMEMSKALDFAQGFKDKNEHIEVEMHKLAEKHHLEVQALHHKLDDKIEALSKVRQEIDKMVSEKEDCLEKIKVLEEDTKKDKSVLLTAKKELDKKSKLISGYEADLAALKEEKGTLVLTLRDEKSKNSVLEQHKKSLQAALDETKKKEKSLREEIKDTGTHVEKLKVELRDYYQEQVEIVVRDKLREFQNQLDVAEKSLRGELESKEQALNEFTARQIKQVSEKHQLEMKLLEEKHREELQLCQLQLAQATEQVTRLESKLKSYNSRKGEIVEKLHGVMENHWHQALQIITGNSPLSSRPHPHPRLDTNGRESTHETWPVTHNSTVRDSGSSEERKHSQTNPLQKDVSDDGQITSRVPQEKTSNRQLTEQDLKKYIEMLLNRSPGNPVPETNSSSAVDWQHQLTDGKGTKYQQSNQLPRWENVDRLDTQRKSDSQSSLTATIPGFDLSKLSQVETKSGKPPWK